MRTRQPRIPEVLRGKYGGTEMFGKKFSKMWKNLTRTTRLSSSPDIPEKKMFRSTPHWTNFRKFKQLIYSSWQVTKCWRTLCQTTDGLTKTFYGISSINVHKAKRTWLTTCWEVSFFYSNLLTSSPNLPVVSCCSCIPSGVWKDHQIVREIFHLPWRRLLHRLGPQRTLPFFP